MILHLYKKQMPKRKSRRKSKRKSRRTRPYKLDKHARARRRHKKRRHKSSRITGHHKRMLRETMHLNQMLEQLAKQYKPDIDRRNYRNDPEYAFSSERTQEFKRGFPNPDVNLLRPQGTNTPPHRGNFPNWRPEWVHTYEHPHAG